MFFTLHFYLEKEPSNNKYISLIEHSFVIHITVYMTYFETQRTNRDTNMFVNNLTVYTFSHQ